jgi:hypothetical protein
MIPPFTTSGARSHFIMRLYRIKAGIDSPGDETGLRHCLEMDRLTEEVKEVRPEGKTGFGPP